MKGCYINGMACISAQKTFDTGFPEGVSINETENVLPAIKPDYSKFIAPAAGRRMAAGVKNGIAASAKALEEAGIQAVDAIITGTGMGCNIDSQKFLQAVIENSEEFLTPTSFIQSTHNTVGAQIALEKRSNVYNFVYVNGAVSFESALIDAKLQIDGGEASNILVGGIEELAENRTEFLKLGGDIKAYDCAPYAILGSGSEGAVLSEGAVFMVLSDLLADTTYAEIRDIAIYNTLENDEVIVRLTEFLATNGLAFTDVNAIVLGCNGDVRFDHYYNTVAEQFKDIQQLYYKHLCGEFNTATSFGLWMAANIVKAQHVPDVVKINSIDDVSLNTILLYNQYKGKDHSFTLISKA